MAYCLSHRGRIRALTVGVGLLVLALMGCGAPGSDAQAPPTAQSGSSSGSESSGGAAAAVSSNINMGTHSVGSSYFSMGSAVAKVVNDNSDVKITIKPFVGPNAWMPMLDRGDLELGISSLPDAVWAFEGSVGYPEPINNVRLLFSGFTDGTPGIVVRRDSGISRIAELRGKRVASDYGGNQISAQLVGAFLASVGMSWDDVVPVPVAEAGSGFKLLRENRVDATFGAAPTSSYAVETHNAIGLRALNLADVTPEEVEAFPSDVLSTIRQYVPGSVPRVVNQGTGYIEEDRTLIYYPKVLSASASLSDDDAYQIVKTIWEHYEEMEPVYKAMAGFNQETLFSAEPDVPYHPGAVRFFKEAGLWNDDVEKRQSELLAKAQ